MGMNLDHYMGGEPKPDLADAEAMRFTCRSFTQLYHDLREQTLGRTRWLGRSVVKSPMDLLVLQEIVAETRPDLIIETGVLAGGTTYFLATMLDLLEIDGTVVGVDIDLRGAGEHVSAHPKVELIEGSSTDPAVVAQLTERAAGRRVMVDLDADHTAEHVSRELELLAPLVSPGCYLIVEDTWIGRSVRREWAPGPADALDEWLREDRPFAIDRWRERFLLSHNSGGYLRRIAADGAVTDGPPRRDEFFSPELELAAAGERTGGGVAPIETENERLRARVEQLEAELDRLRPERNR